MYNNLGSIQSSAEFKDNLDIELTEDEIELISGKIIDIRQISSTITNEHNNEKNICFTSYSNTNLFKLFLHKTEMTLILI